MNGEDTRESATMTDLDALKAALEKATAGKWYSVRNTGVIMRHGPPEGVGTVQIGRIGDYRDAELLRFNRERWDADVAAIVLAVNTLREPGALEALALGRRVLGGDEALVEAMARGVCRHGDYDPDEMMANDGPRWRYYEPGARAALAALVGIAKGESDAR